METPGFAETETISSDLNSTIAVRANIFKRYLGAANVRYIYMGQASKFKTSQSGILKRRHAR